MENQSYEVKPRIYVACLASYNNGELHGRWIDAAQDADLILSEIQEMLSRSAEPYAEEWAIHDYEGFGEIDIHEYAGIERVSALAQLIEKHGMAFSVWYKSQDAHHLEPSDLEDVFQTQFQGVFESNIAFADELLESTGCLAELPEWARNYFDYEGYARDLQLSGDYTFTRHEFQTYVFSNL